MTLPVRTVLWFEKNGLEAADFYCSLVPDSRITSSYASDHGGPDGDSHFEVIDFMLGGVPYQILEAGPMFPLSECVSIMVRTSDQAQTDYLWESLVEGGGSHGPCGWLKDRFGLSWQIVPEPVMQLMTGPDTGRAARAIAAVMTMGRIDIATVEAAAS